MTCDGGTCYPGCTCSESAWAEKLAAAEERARRLEGTSDTLRCKLAMEEGRAERYRELIAGYLEWGAMTGSDRDLWESRFRAALAPPPEAASSCENFNANLRAAVAAAPPVTGYTVVNERGEERHVEFPPPEAEKRGEG